MNRKFMYLSVIAVLLLASACDSKKILSQDDAVRAITTFASAHSFTFGGGSNGCVFSGDSIASIEPLIQFSDTQSSTIIALKCAHYGNLHLKVLFQKDVNNKWFLTKIEDSDLHYGVDADAIRPFQDLRVPVQP